MYFMTLLYSLNTSKKRIADTIKLIKMRFIILQLFQQLLASFENFQFFETAEPGQRGGGGGEQTVGPQVTGTNTL